MALFFTPSDRFQQLLDRPIESFRSVQKRRAFTASPGAFPLPGLVFFPETTSL